MNGMMMTCYVICYDARTKPKQTKKTKNYTTTTANQSLYTKDAYDLRTLNSSIGIGHWALGIGH